MPRNEVFLDPGAGPLASFAWDLRALRESAGKVPYRVLAKRAGFCASTLSVAASGAKLPSLDVTLAYVQACGGDPETWRERWHALAAQHPPTPPGPDAQSGLHVAPPYDADEREEQDEREEREASKVREDQDDSAPLGTAAPRPSLDSAGLTDRKPRRGSRRLVMPISRVATVALTLVTAVLGMKVFAEGTGSGPSAGPGASPVSASPSESPMQQADALYLLIYQFAPMRSDTNDAIWDLNGCRNLSNAQSKLRAIARKRQEQVEQLAALNVSRVPDHAQLVAALKHAWLTSAQSDTAYANIAADLQSGCTSGAVRTDPNYQQADNYAQAATAAKAEATRVWNNNADELGQLRIFDAEL
jgi:hypothetical protein